MGRYDLRGAGKEQRLAYRVAFIPKNAEPILVCEDLALYQYPIGTAGGYGVMVFWGSAGKPTEHYTFKTLAKAQAHMEEWIDRVSLHRVEQLKKRTTRAAWTNPATVGTILSTCWGYDQTNVEFYVITRVSGKRVWIREIAADYEATGHMSGKTWPAMPIRMVGEETMHTAQPCGDGGVSIKIQHHYAHIETGRAHQTSSYA